MKLNRSLQRQILQEFAKHYPFPYPKSLSSLCPDFDVLFANLAYMSEHGLIQHGLYCDDEGYGEVADTSHITARGLDFLADDGGLSAILGMVTIKIHDDTLKSLVEAKILQSDLPQPDKRRYLDALRELPAETTKHLALKLVDLGLANAPAALGVIGTALGLGAGG